MRKFTAILVCLSVLPFMESAPAAGAIKPGNACTAKGEVKTSQGYKYTCIKSGKKLVWNKGVLVTKPAAKPVVTPAPSPTPTVIAAPSPPQVPVALWQETQFNLLAQFKKLKPATIQELNFILSPNADKSMSKLLQDSYQEPISYLSNLYVNPAKVTFLVMNEKDKDWWLANFKELAPTQMPEWWGGSHCQPSPRAHCGYGSAPNPDGTFHFGQLLGSEIAWRENDYTIAYHESIHVYQLGLLGNRMQALPYWFAEGQACYLGYTFSHRFIDSRIQRQNEINRMKNLQDFGKMNDKEWSDWLQKIDSDSQYTFSNGLGYSAGELILEALYNENDFRKVHEWMVTIKNGSDYKTGFKTIFGQDYDAWLRDTAAPYLNSQI